MVAPVSCLCLTQIIVSRVEPNYGRVFCFTSPVHPTCKTGFRATAAALRPAAQPRSSPGTLPATRTQHTRYVALLFPSCRAKVKIEHLNPNLSYFWLSIFRSDLITSVYILCLLTSGVHMSFVRVYMSLSVPYYMNGYVVYSLHPEQYLISKDPGLQSLKYNSNSLQMHTPDSYVNMC